MSSADQWRWTDDEGVQRLLRGDELRAALADGRLKPSTLVWKRGMRSWIAAGEVDELRDAIDDDGPDTVTRQVPKDLGTKAMPTPSIPAPGIRAPQNLVDINALRAAGVRAPVNTLVGVGTKDDALPAAGRNEVRIPGAPRVPKLDGGWRDGAARKDRDEDTVTALVKDEEPGTLSEHHQPGAEKKKTVPPPRKRGKANTIRGDRGSRKPPPPVRARPTAPLGGAAGISRTLRPQTPKKPPNPSVPPPVKSSEVLSERFEAQRHTKAQAASTLAGHSDRRKAAKRVAPHGAAQRKAPSLPPPRRPSVPAPAREPSAPLAGSSPLDSAARAPEPTAPPPLGFDSPPRAPEPTAPPPLFGTSPLDSASRAPEPTAPPPQPSVPPTDDRVRSPGAKAPMAKTGPLPEMRQLSDLGPSRASQPAADWPVATREPSGALASLSAQPAVAAQPASQSGPRAASNALTDIPPRPPMVAGLTLKYPIVAGVGAAALLAVVLSFVFGRMSAPAKANLTDVVRARTGWAVVPLFARTRAQTTKDPRPCLMLRAPSRFAPGATPRIPIEVASTANERIAVGYAQSSLAPRGVLVDPATGKAEIVFSPEPKEDEEGVLERIVPLIGGDDVTFGVSKEAVDGLYRSVYVPADKPFVVGFDAENVLKADEPGAAAARMWSLAENMGRADALRVAKVPGAGFPLTYRQSQPREPGYVYYAMLDETGVVSHPSIALAAPDGEVGKPYIAAGNGEVSVVFAHRQKVEGARWELRWARGPVSEPLKDAALVDIPPGGPGGDAGAPAITPLSGGRWLLMWMEGSSGAWTIRAQTYDRKYRPLGEALRVSPETGNFGQGVVGVVGEKGVVVFLLEAGGDYEVWGTVLQCQ